MKLTKAIIFFLSFMGSAVMARQVDVPPDSTIIKQIEGLTDSSRYHFYSDEKKAYDFAYEAKTLSETSSYFKGLADNNTILGHINTFYGKDFQALNHYLAAEQYYLQIRDTAEIASIISNIAGIYINQNQLAKGLDKLNQWVKLLANSSIDTVSVEKLQNNIAVALIGLNQPDSALKILIPLFDSVKTGSNLLRISIYAQNIGEAYLALNDYEKAGLYLVKAYSIAKASNDTEGMIHGLIYTGKLQIEKGADSGIIHVLEAITIAEDHGYKSILTTAHQIAADYFLTKNDYKNASTHLVQYAAIKDSIFTPEITMALSELQSKEIEQLKNKEIADLQMLSEKVLENTRFRNYLLLAIMVVIVVSFVLGMIMFFQRQNSTRRLARQKLEIEEQKEAIEKANTLLQENNDKLNSISDEKSNLIRMVAHDLKSPLNRINGLSSVVMLEEGKLSDDQVEAMSKMKTTSLQLSKLIDKILDVEAIESQQPNADFHSVMIQPLMDEYMEGFKVVAERKNILLVEDYSKNQLMVNIDANYASQIFENLISNAIKFSPPNTVVQIVVKDIGNNVRIEIQDEGPGLTKKDKSKLFKKFQRLSAQPTGNEDSTGLGLSIVKKYVAAMNGKVWAESMPGEGSKFIVELDGISVENKVPKQEAIPT